MKEYTQVIKGHYDDNGAVRAIDILNNKPLTADFMKTRPDIKQRVEKAINTKTYLCIFFHILQFLHLFFKSILFLFMSTLPAL